MFLFNPGLNSMRVAALGVFWISLTSNAGGYQRSKGQTKPLLVIDIEVLVPVGYAAGHLRMDQG